MIIESPAIVAMKQDLRWLQETSSQYEKLEKSGNVDTVYFLEGTGQSSDDPEISTLRGWPDNFLRMKKTHSRMIQYPAAEDEDFQKVEKCVKDIVANL